MEEQRQKIADLFVFTWLVFAGPRSHISNELIAAGVVTKYW